ncbi:hypothetical protein AB0M22_28305 [Nocardia sp. NPDC051756]|uniref:hypothetical protein n=1 Tax=Nocardia sp. NPDC051756 TaxID=3154751 RepID=UPI00343DDA26
MRNETISMSSAAEPRARKRRLLGICTPIVALVAIATGVGVDSGISAAAPGLDLRDTVQQFITTLSTNDEQAFLGFYTPECRTNMGPTTSGQQTPPPPPEEIPVIVALKDDGHYGTVILKAPADKHNLPLRWVNTNGQWLISCAEEATPTLQSVPPDQQISLRDTAAQALNRWSRVSSTDIDSVEAIAEYFLPACRQLVTNRIYSVVDFKVEQPAVIVSVDEHGDTGTVRSLIGARTESQDWEKAQGHWLMNCVAWLPHQS